MVKEPEKIDPAQQIKEEASAPRQEAMVKGIAPAQPAPLPVEKPVVDASASTSRAGETWFARMLEWFRAKPAAPPSVAEVKTARDARPADRARDGRRDSRRADDRERHRGEAPRRRARGTSRARHGAAVSSAATIAASSVNNGTRASATRSRVAAAPDRKPHRVATSGATAIAARSASPRSRASTRTRAHW